MLKTRLNTVLKEEDHFLYLLVLIMKQKQMLRKKQQHLPDAIYKQISLQYICCDMGQNDTISKIELNPSIVLSSDNTNCKNDIQLFHQLFDELSVYRNYH